MASAGSSAERPTPRVDSLVVGMTWLLVLSVAQRGIGLGRNVLVCRYLDPVELGTWNLLFQFLVVAPPLLVLGIPGTFGRYVEAYRLRGALGDFLSKTLRVTGILVAVGVIAMVFGRQWIAQELFNDASRSDAIFWLSGVLVVVVAYNLLNQLLAALRLPRALSIINLVNTFVFTVSAIGLLLVTQWGALGVAVSYGAGCLASSLAALWLLRGWWRDSVGTETGNTDRFWAKLAPLALWIWTGDMCLNLFGLVDRYMIVHMSGHDSQTALALVGQYHSGLVLGVLLISLGEMLSSVALPYLTHDWEQGRLAAVAERLNRSLQFVALLLTACAGLLIVLSPLLFDQIMHGKYTVGRDLLPLTMAYCVWYTMVLQLKNFLWLCERGYWVTVVLLVGVGVNIALNLVWLPRYSVAGAVAATALSNAIVLMILAGVSYRYGWRGDRLTYLAMAVPGGLMLGGWGGLVAVAMVSAIWATQHPREIQQVAQRCAWHWAALGVRWKGWTARLAASRR